MKDIKISDMMKMQMSLWECNKEKWSPMEPKYGRDSLLWMIEEIGEVIAIIKKKKENEIMENKEVREKFVEEIADVYMYLTDTLLRYGISADELGEIYLEKHKKNMGRNFTEEHRAFLQEND